MVTFTMIAGGIQIWTFVAPELLPKPLVVPVPDGTRLEQAVSMARMEGVKFTKPSSREVVAKFFARPTLTSPLNADAAVAGLVSVSPFLPPNLASTFDAGDCHFIGRVSAFSASSRQAQLHIVSVSCVDNKGEVFVVEEGQVAVQLATATSLERPTDNSVDIQPESGAYSTPLFSNVLLKFPESFTGLSTAGRAKRK